MEALGDARVTCGRCKGWARSRRTDTDMPGKEYTQEGTTKRTKLARELQGSRNTSIGECRFGRVRNVFFFKQRKFESGDFEIVCVCVFLGGCTPRASLVVAGSEGFLCF